MADHCDNNNFLAWRWSSECTASSTVEELRFFLKIQGEKLSGRKAKLVQRCGFVKGRGILFGFECTLPRCGSVLMSFYRAVFYKEHPNAPTKKSFDRRTSKEAEFAGAPTSSSKIPFHLMVDRLKQYIFLSFQQLQVWATLSGQTNHVLQIQMKLLCAKSC